MTLLLGFIHHVTQAQECEFIGVLYIHMEMIPLDMLNLFFHHNNVKSVIGMAKRTGAYSYVINSLFSINSMNLKKKRVKFPQ